MTNSLSIRRRRTIVGGAVLTLALGGLATAVPAEASAGSPTAASSSVGTNTFGQEIPLISDSLGSSTPDAILTCAISRTTVNGNGAIAIPAGCLTLYNGEWVKVTWTGTTNEFLLLTEQTDGNLVLTYSVSAALGPEWTSNTTFAGNANGPGCLAQFKSTGNLAVSNCDSTQIYTTGTTSYPNAVLVFAIGADNNFQIFDSLGGSVIWAP